MKYAGLLNTENHKTANEVSDEDIKFIDERIEHLRGNNLSKEALAKPIV
jgi:hypothetical protein